MTSLAKFFGLLMLFSTTAQAHEFFQFSCTEQQSDFVRTIELRVSTDHKTATLVNYWGDGKEDTGTLAGEFRDQLTYKGFPIYVDDGVANSGRLYINHSMLDSGKGTVVLFNLYQEDEEPTPRRSRLDCEAKR